MTPLTYLSFAASVSLNSSVAAWSLALLLQGGWTTVGPTKLSEGREVCT